MTLEPIRVGVTGSRYGGTQEQDRALRRLLLFELAPVAELHNGDCKGWDERSSVMAHMHGIPVILHPGYSSRWRESPTRAWFAHAAEYRPPGPFFVRDRAMVDETEVLIALLRKFELSPAGGTTYTVTYARSLKRPIALVMPNGWIRWENLAQLDKRDAIPHGELYPWHAAATSNPQGSDRS